ncbi:MAG TPA: glycosyltransferase 87 family protein [Gaiellaceae bacterium]|nr:glycosyltransferase 87 family protein [Gaiellaceae bacterium]
MTAKPESSSRPADTGFAVAATLAAVVLFLVAWAVLHRGYFTHHPIVDTPVYERYGSALDDGQVPYRDFALEYPPGALPVFALPALGAAGSETFRVRFEALMAFFGEALIVCVAIALVALGAGRRRLLGALGFVSVAPLALGPVVLSRFDLWPTALVAAAVAALVSGRLRLGHVALGAAVAAKLYPVVLVPIAVAYVWRREGRREALVCAAALTAVVALVFLPFLVLAPDGLWHSLWNQASRPLQIESLGAGLLLVAHHVFGTAVTMESSHGSQNLAGSAPDALAAAQSLLQIAALIAVWILFVRGPAGRDRLVEASGAALVAFIVGGKVLSPQFLIWLIPVIPLVRGRRGLSAAGLLGAALVLTQLWFPYRYWQLALHFGTLQSWLVLARDLVLVALLLVLLLPLRHRDPDGLAARRSA